MTTHKGDKGRQSGDNWGRGQSGDNWGRGQLGKGTIRNCLPLSRVLRSFGVSCTCSKGFEVGKGQSGQDWGLRARLSRVFDPADGKTVMLAFDHGYFQGPTSGLERIDLNIAPLAEEADALMCTRGSLRTSISPATQSGLVLRASGGPTHAGSSRTYRLRRINSALWGHFSANLQNSSLALVEKKPFLQNIDSVSQFLEMLHS